MFLFYVIGAELAQRLPTLRRKQKHIRTMKRFLLSVSVLTLALCGFISCSQQREWSREQRQALRHMLRDYRQMVYLNNLTEAEYMLFADEVAADIEQSYPIYTTFIELPAVNDTVQVYVVATIVDQLNADARNMRHPVQLTC